MDEKELVEKCKRKDKTAYQKLYEAYAPHMKGICLRYTGDEMLAEDVLHDGFVKIFVSIGSFQYRGEGSLKAWMSKVFCNESLAFIKRTLQIPTSSLDTIDVAEETDDTSSWNEIPQSVLMQFITTLTLNYRTVFNMYVFEDMSHKEISKELGITEEASRARLSRAKSILIKKIQNYLSVNG